MSSGAIRSGVSFNISYDQEAAVEAVVDDAVNSFAELSRIRAFRLSCHSRRSGRVERPNSGPQCAQCMGSYAAWPGAELGINRAPSDGVVPALERQILTQDLRPMRTRLLGKEPELFSEIDRLHSEAEFRLALAPALGALALALALRQPHWPAVIPVFSLIVLGMSGWIRDRRANDALLDALVLERVNAPTRERMAESAERFNTLAASRGSDRAASAAQGRSSTTTSVPVMRSQEVDT